jgi:O-methyltransferase
LSLPAAVKRGIKSHGLLYAPAAALRSRRPIENLLRLRRNLLFSRVITRTLVSYDRLLNTYDLARRVERFGLPGAYVECGVWRGGAAALLALMARREGRQRRTHLFDSFQGLPAPTDPDETATPEGSRSGELSPVGLYVATRDDVSRFLFEDLGLDPAAVVLHEGWFQHTLPATAARREPIALLRIDADWYESVKVCLESLYPSVVDGGYVILDDYGSYPGCRRAFEEFRRAAGLEVSLHQVDAHGVWFQKPVARA